MEIEQLCQLIQAVSDSKLTEFSYEEDGVKITMASGKETVIQQIVPAPAPVAAVPAAGIPAAVPVASPAGAAAPQSAAPAAGTQEAAADAPKPGQVITSPLVGVFYAAPSEDAEPFVKVGDPVKKGQVVGIVEAMKLMNEIECEYDGVVAAVLVENKQVVEYGQPLFRIAKQG